MIGFRTLHPPSTAPSQSSHQSYDNSTVDGGADNALVRRSNFNEQPPQRTLDDVRDQVAAETAIRIITKAETIDGVKVGVMLTFPNSSTESFLRTVSELLSVKLSLRDHLFAIGTTASPTPTSTSTPTSPPISLIICGSSEDLVQRAVLLASAKFIGRIDAAHIEEFQWVASIRGLGTEMFDETALQDVVRKSARSPIDPLLPPPGSKSIDIILNEARSKIQRVKPMQAYDELRESQVHAPTFLVDIRPAAQRAREGEIHGALVVERNVLEWRFDPRSPARLAIADRYDLRIIVFCQEGYTSSLAAYSLQQLGLLNSTDIIGGFQAWKDAGLPISNVIPERPTPRSLISLAGSVV